MKSKARASITVFISLIFLLIMSLIGTVIEFARLQSAEVLVEQNTKLSLESVYTNYDKEVFEDYGIFLLHECYLPRESFQKEMEYYIDENFEEDFLYDISLKSMDSISHTYATKENVNVVKQQMISSGKYSTVDAIENIFTSTTQPLKDSAKTAKEVSEKISVDVDEELKGQLHKLMQYVDGVKFLDNQVFVQGKFAKKISFETEKEASVGIKNTKIADKVKAKVCFAGDMILEVDKIIDEIETLSLKQEDNASIKKLKKQIRKKIKKGKSATKTSIEYTEKSIKTLKKISKKDKKSLKIERMDVALDAWMEVLQAWEDVIECSKDISKDEISYESFLKKYFDAKNKIAKCNVKEMSFDYSGYTEEKTEDPLEILQNVMDMDSVSMVVPKEINISEKTISLDSTISKGAGKKNTWSDNGYEKGIQNTKLDDVDKEVQENLDTYSKKAGENSENILDISKNKIFLIQYTKEYFLDFTSIKNQKDEKEHILDYELEYIVSGKDSDRKNLQAGVDKIMNIRLPVNMSYILTQKQLRAKAKATSAALLSVFQIPGLVEAGEYVILLCLAYEESLVDVSALLDGKRVPLAKNKSNFKMTYEEMFSFTKETIAKKAAKYEKNSEGIKTGFAYSDYLMFFLATTKEKTLVYRCMDIIQENIRLRYDSQYELQEGIVNSDFSISFTMPSKVFSLPLGNIQWFEGYKIKKDIGYGY